MSKTLWSTRTTLNLFGNCQCEHELDQKENNILYNFSPWSRPNELSYRCETLAWFFSLQQTVTDSFHTSLRVLSHLWFGTFSPDYRKK